MIIESSVNLTFSELLNYIKLTLKPYLFYLINYTVAFITRFITLIYKYFF